MLIKSEKQLLNFVKYSPIVVILIIAIIVNSLIYIQNSKNFQKDLEIYKKNYMETNKSLIKQHVEKIYSDILIERDVKREELEIKLKDKVDNAYAIVSQIYKEVSKEGKEKSIHIIKEALRNIRFNNGSGYYYLTDMEGTSILHPINTYLENTSILNAQDVRGTFIVKDLINNLKEKDSYLNSYYWTKPNNKKKSFKKVTYNRVFRPLDLIISSGEYIDDFTNELKEHMIEDHIKKTTFRDNNYLFIFDYNGVQLAHVKESYLGQNRLEVEDKNGFKITKEIINKAKEGSGYIKYIASVNPKTGKPSEKISYIKGLDDWSWAIGTGFYTNELNEYLNKKEKELKDLNDESLKKIMLISLVLTIALLFTATYISKVLQRFFNNYNERIKKEITSNRKKDVILYQQSKMASMGEMIGNIAHQWRQPLNLISTAASRIKLEDELNILTKENQTESLNAIIKSTKFLSQTIDDFREFFNPNKIATEFSTTKLYEKTIQLTSARLTNKDIKIIPNIDNVDIISYENELLQALLNILNNAIDAFEDKEQEEKIIFFDIKKAENCKIQDCETPDCIQSNQEGSIIITIKDNAGGIPKEYLKKIFEAYFTTKHQSQGTGIGLYMTYQIIQKHLEGYISVENKSFEYNSKKYLGAEFIIVLPFS